LAVMAVVAVHQSVGLGTRCCRSACPCVQTHGLPTRTPHTGSPHATRRVPACSNAECATHTESELGARRGR